ncbi:MAG: phosphatase PAP2 family protein [Nitrospiraceae bacterium]
MGKLDPVTRHALRVTSVSLCCATLAAAFWGVLQLDLPLARFLRSVHLPWLELAGDVGSRLGSGAVLAGISGALLAIGLISKQTRFRRAGLESLIAHAAVALTAQALKHLIGRPRPRMTHGGGFQFGPSWDTGLDSFPSGHAAASFAVAAVLARRFPRARWLLYGAASVVALSRVARGSHFPTDVLAGVSLGLMAGYVVANPIRVWRSSLADALTGLAPYLIGAFALLWTAVHAAPDGWPNAIMFSVGASGMAIGVGIRLYWTGKGPRDVGLSGSSGSSGSTKQTQLLASRLLIAIGLALSTGSWLVTALTVLLVIARWLEGRGSGQSRGEQPPMRPLIELTLAVGLGLSLVVIQSVKGVLPLL